MMRYMQHTLWMLLRPLIHPFRRMRQRAQAEREAELELYKKEQEAALRELKIELALAHRQGVRQQIRQQAGDGS